MIIPLLAAIAPFILWPIEYLFPYPYLVEELTKAFLVFLILKSPGIKKQVLKTILVGAIFAFSESVLYLFNILATGSTQIIAQRLVTTTPLHILTALVIYLPSAKSKKLMPVGVVFAVIIHYLFNLYIQ